MQAYASQLAGVKDEALKEAGTKIILIGCGEYEPIQFYAGMLCTLASSQTLNRPNTPTIQRPPVSRDPSMLILRVLYFSILT